MYIYIYICMYIITIFWQCIIYWLVVEPPLWKIWVKVSWDDDIPNWMEKSNMFQTTNQCIYIYICMWQGPLGCILFLCIQACIIIYITNDITNDFLRSPRTLERSAGVQACTSYWHILMLSFSYPLVNVYITMERSTHVSWGKSTISMAIFNSYVSHYQRVNHH